ncbi:MAG TPA: hypothetical protein VFU31_05435 [Candidatus Binatia bacterium]|nr:hypothetical protein [Candidatus Binatia bacterium]
MNEKEYILIGNLANIKTAINVIRDTLPGFDGVLTEEGKREILLKLIDLRDKMQKKVKVKG